MKEEWRSSIHIRLLHKPDELELVKELEALVWEDEDPVPVSHMIASVKSGGMVLGAFQEEQLVGFQYSFAGFDGKTAYLCSHNLGIHPDFRKLGIGEMLKLRQREEAQKIGYDLIAWTYDPLETVNAYLNMNKLGGVCSDYIENCYGEMTDILNHGLPTDRFLLKWWIKEKRVEDQLKNRLTKPKYGINPDARAVFDTVITPGGLLEPLQLDSSCFIEAGILLVPVPAQFQQIKAIDLELARKWRMITRDAFKLAFEQGWTATKVSRSEDEQLVYYHLEKITITE